MKIRVKLVDRQITPAFSGFWYRVSSLLGWFRASLASLHFVRISLFLLKTNDALFPAPDRFPQVSFRLRSVSFGRDHHVLRTRNRACIAWPRDFIVPASNVVLHHLKKRSRETMSSRDKSRKTGYILVCGILLCRSGNAY